MLNVFSNKTWQGNSGLFKCSYGFMRASKTETHSTNVPYFTVWNSKNLWENALKDWNFQAMHLLIACSLMPFYDCKGKLLFSDCENVDDVSDISETALC